MNESNCSFPFTEAAYINVAIVKAAVSAASIILCSTVLFFLILFKQWKVFSQKLVIYLFTAVILQSFAFLINKIDFDASKAESSFFVGFCKFSGFLTQITTWMFQGAIFVISIYLFLLVVVNYNTAKYEVLYVLCIFALPLVVNWIPFIRQSYNRAGLWCWIRSFNYETCQKNTFGEFLEYFLYFIPIYLVLTIGLVLYIIMFTYIFVKLKKSTYTNDRNKRQQLQLVRQELLSLAAYPALFFVLNILIIANRIHGSFKPREPSLVLWYLASLAGPLQGIVSVLTFTLATKWWKNLSKAKFKASFMRDNKAEEYNFEGTVISDSLETTTMHFHSKYKKVSAKDTLKTEGDLITPVTSISSWSAP